MIGFSVSCHRGKGGFFRFVVARGDRFGKHVTIRLQGWIEVPPVNQCKSNIYLVQVVPRACDASVQDICPFDLRMDWLFKAAPRGC